MVLLDDPIMQGGTSMHHSIDTILKRLRQDIAAAEKKGDGGNYTCFHSE